MPISRWNVDLPTAAELSAMPKGVVLHWTGGGPRANSVDLAAYHFVVEVDGRVVAGKWPVASNLRKLVDDKYARHTGGYNSFRVGISCAGMKDYKSPSFPGSFPLTEVQVNRMVEVAAYFIEMANLDPVNPKHLCTHQEVWTLHGIKGTQNDKKRDIEYLPYRPDLKPTEVGNHLREMAARYLEAMRDAFAQPTDPADRAAEAAVVLPDPLVLLDARGIVPEIVVPVRQREVKPPSAPLEPLEPLGEPRPRRERAVDGSPD